MAAPPVIRLHPEDSVAIARATLLPGAPVADNVVAVERIPAGHKVAMRAIAKAEAVRRYGQIIGFASTPISPGQHVHVQNCEMGDFAKDYAYGRGCEADRVRRSAGDVPGHPPRRWPRGDAQLHRHPDQRELFRPCRRSWSPTCSAATRSPATIRWPTSPMSTAWLR